MGMTVSALLVASTFTIYPPPEGPRPRIEAITDRGPILEMIVHCRKGTGILSYSKIERLYCSPRGCSRNRDTAIVRLCS
jgi:hypothetical protein